MDNILRDDRDCVCKRRGFRIRNIIEKNNAGGKRKGFTKRKRNNPFYYTCQNSRLENTCKGGGVAYKGWGNPLKHAYSTR